MSADELGQKLRDAMGRGPVVAYANRRPATSEEAKIWESEAVIIMPSSLDVVVHQAYSRRDDDEKSSSRPGPEAVT